LLRLQHIRNPRPRHGHKAPPTHPLRLPMIHTANYSSYVPFFQYPLGRETVMLSKHQGFAKLRNRANSNAPLSGHCMHGPYAASLP
jgi:hypothetical protein